MTNCLVYIKLMILDTHRKHYFDENWKNIKCLLMEHFSETTAAYEGGTKRSWFSGTCHSTVPTFQECETSTLCWKHFEKWGKLLKNVDTYK